ncbi:MAG TPA: hypothetical protein VHV78_16050 [Gemmatimonadaceae bacterium]|jgi:hypothetical protein|nr:hypothetical protein [Gemmatimonadaceae bacterium]
MLCARQCEVRVKGTSFDIESQRVTGDLDIMVKKLEPWFRQDTDSYDAGPPKVWEGEHAAHGHEQLTVPAGDRRQARLKVVDAILTAVAKEFEREMETRFAHPRQIGRTFAKARGRGDDLSAKVGRRINRQKETHRSSATR